MDILITTLNTTEKLNMKILKTCILLKTRTGVSFCDATHLSLILQNFSTDYYGLCPRMNGKLFSYWP